MTIYGGVRPVHRSRKWAEISSPSLTPHFSLKQRQVWVSLGEVAWNHRSYPLLSSAGLPFGNSGIQHHKTGHLTPLPTPMGGYWVALVENR